MAIIIGSARHDEHGKLTGGAAGDQTGQEVATQSFYVHQRGWYVIRAKSANHANKIAERMKSACENSNIGYDQTNRLGVIEHGIDTKTKTECDCSSLVRACVKEATGKDPGNFITSNEPAILIGTGLFMEKKSYYDGMTLYTGDILVTKTKGHTVVVVSGTSRTTSNASDKTSSSKSKKAYTDEFPTLPIRGYYMLGDGYKQLTSSAVAIQIKRIQSFLNWAINAKLSIDGDYGAKTCASVISFQKKVCITADGKFGKKTLAKAKAYTK